jgi:hypothetical protein
MKEQIQKYARKHIKGGCYLKVTLGHSGLKDGYRHWVLENMVLRKLYGASREAVTGGQ